MNVISFEKALALLNAGIKRKAEMYYVFQVIEKKETKTVAKGPSRRTVTETWEEWDGGDVKLVKADQLPLILSDRFYDSWTDAAAPAYNCLELLQFLPGVKIDSRTDPDNLADRVLKS